MTHNSVFTLLLIEDSPGDARYIEELVSDIETLLSDTETLLSDAETFLSDAEASLSDTGEPPARSRRYDTGRVESESGTDGERMTLIHETRLRQGLEQFEKVDPDIVLLNLNLPDSNGLETLTRLRERAQAVPVVVLTEDRNRKQGVKALQQGAEGYLVKDEVDADLLVRSVYHALERNAYECELRRMETLLDGSTDVNALIDPDGTVRYLTPSATRVLGYDPDELVAENWFDYLHPDDRQIAQTELTAMVEDTGYQPTFECRFAHTDGSWIVLQTRGHNLLEEPMIQGLVVYAHDITELKGCEQRLERQRKQLTALNNLYGVVREVTDVVVQHSTRDEIEQTVCECLAAMDSYQCAWIGELETGTDRITVRAEAGVDDYLETSSISLDSDQKQPGTLLRDAIQTRELQLVQNIEGKSRDNSWHDHAIEHGVRSLLAVPIIHEDRLYGLFTVYADRAHAFTPEERSVLGQLGEIVGHAITAVERKRALTADELVELELQIRRFFDVVDAPVSTDDRITFAQAVLASENTYVVYGETTVEGLETLEQLTAQHPDWDDLRVRTATDDVAKFEVRLTEPPVIATVVACGGTVDHAVIEDGEYTLTAHFPTGTDTRERIEAIQEAYPTAEVVAHRQVTRTDSVHRLTQTWMASLTDRQQTVLQTAYHAGFFEWPRQSSGEEIAETLGIAPSTFSQHIRKAESKLLSVVFDEISYTGGRND